MLLYIIRHGETEWNVQRRTQGSSDIPLNENGRELARITAQGLKDVKFDLVITSPLSRAVETARLIVGERDVPFVMEPRIQEIGWGEWEGYYMEDFVNNDFMEVFQRMRQDPYHFQGAPGGESTMQVCERTKAFYEDLIHNPQYQDLTILVSTHGFAVRALLRNVYEDTSDFWHGEVPPNCGINIVRVENGKSTLEEEDKIFYDISLSKERINMALPPVSKR